MYKNLADIIINEKTLTKRVDEIAQQISRDYKNERIFLLGILKGSLIFLADLMRKIKTPLEIDFMSISSYGNSTKSSGVVKILKDLDSDITNKNVIIVEDIVDTGLTLSYLLEYLSNRKPMSLKVCSLLYKSSCVKKSVQIHYRGFDIPDKLVVGYGLDFNEEYRNLPYIGTIKI